MQRGAPSFQGVGKEILWNIKLMPWATLSVRAVKRKEEEEEEEEF